MRKAKRFPIVCRIADMAKNMGSSRFAHQILIMSLALLLSIGVGVSSVDAIQVTETFDDDPASRGWGGVDNRSYPQDYGFSTSDITGGTVNPPNGTATFGGEFGGTLTRQAATMYGGMDNFYGVDLGGEIDIITESFSVSGVIHLQWRDGGSGYYLGYSRGVSSYIDPPGEDGDASNFIGLQFDDGHNGIAILWGSGGGRDRDVGAGNLPVGTTVPFSMDYDPNGNDGRGELTTVVNTTSHVFQIPGSNKYDLDPLTHFGIFPVSASGAESTVWIDDLTYTTKVGGSGGPACDFTGDSACDVADIDDLFGQGNLVTGVSAAGSVYDLTGDDTLNGDDVAAWLSDAATENGQASAYMSSDIDLDRDVDLTDFNGLAVNFSPGSSAGLFSTGDSDGDGDVDLSDYNALAGSFDPTGYGGAVAVPEPVSLILLSVGGVLVLSRRRGAMTPSSR